MTTTSQSDSPRKRSIFRPRNILVLAALTPILGAVGLWVYVESSNSSRLRAAIDEADRLDPGWRLSELLANRTIPSDSENSAVRAESALTKLPPNWLTTPRAVGGQAAPRDASELLNVFSEVIALPANTKLDAHQTAVLRQELAKLASALADARSLADMGEGRFEFNSPSAIMNQSMTHVSQARELARLLQLDVVLREHEGDYEGALDSARAILGVARSLGDEPVFITQLSRIAIEGVALSSVTRTLAQGEASDGALARVQAALENEYKQPLLTYALRGERAYSFETNGQLARGQKPGMPAMPALRTLPFMGVFHRYNQGLSLEFMNKAVEIAKKRVEEQPGLWEQWKLEAKPPSWPVARAIGTTTYLLIPAEANAAQAYVRSRAALACGQVMVAAERYRIRHGRWPDSIDDLSPEFLAKVPLDPFDAKPIRMQKTEEGLLFYSVGPDRQDDGGKLEARYRGSPGTDFGLRLWELDRRRVAPDAESELPENVFQETRP
jgi:hypothetical protein